MPLDCIKNTLEIRIKAVKRFPDLIGFYETKKKANQEAKNIKENKALISQCIYKVETQEDEAENILLISHTGSGKSTLANVLTNNTNDFKIGEGLNSKTIKFKGKVFNIFDQEIQIMIKYRVFDTVGIGNTKLSSWKVMLDLAEAIYIMRRGIKRVFVVVEKLTDKEMKVFNMAEEIFGKEIFEYITVIISKYNNFKQIERKSNDSDRETLSKKFKCQMDIIYVDSPLLNNYEKQVSNEKDRESTRKALLKYLRSEKCQKNYELENWNTTCVRINDYMNAKKWKDNKDTKGANEKEKSNIKISKAKIRAKIEIFSFGNIHFDAKFKNCCSII
ncbi:hypothetical protein C1645_823990 [Glomus cerebriforme]|uniref:AIG1-type G domain-containing protein n=1 Tax=Glomus cerebriforme TaxID=658196 RepID=A0A397SWD4_9GLOM|nr:hypothetical protein C1645_823990 [Glomus cerebriforme]